MPSSFRRIAFFCFILSGAASVSYQTMWLRSAMTYFGVITPVSSAVLSVFMMGLAVGTFVTGRLSHRLSARRAVLLYAIVEAAIAVLAFMVPWSFRKGYTLLLDSGTGQSATYLFYSCLIITAILLPVCTLIGSTFPLLMKCLESSENTKRPFSFLYYANLSGALLGCLLPCIFIEMYGFQRSLEITMVFNALAALLALRAHTSFPADTPASIPDENITPRRVLPFSAIIILAAFGFVTLGSEAVWLKAFTVTLNTTVYSFVCILAVYLIATALGTLAYRKDSGGRLSRFVMMFLPASAMLPIIFLAIKMISIIHAWVVLSIAPLCFCLGYLTPKIIDNACGKDTRAMSVAYTYNCIGCIFGPVFTTYMLFPVAGIKVSLAAYACVLLPAVFYLMQGARLRQAVAFIIFLAALAPSLFVMDAEEFIEANGELRRDHIGYIGAVGKGNERFLVVNGVGMTVFTNITKNMAHIPLMQRPNAKSALTICFGMGTTTRSLASWPLTSITAVELSKGVIDSFGYFFSDAGHLLADPRVHLINDDGRRFLNRSRDHYDIIVIDPPPPQTSAGSGLLYTDEFISLAKAHLTPDGILQHWIPHGEDLIFDNAVLGAIHRNFKYVKLQKPNGNITGIFITASDSPLADFTPAQEAKILPPAAAKDLMEWTPNYPFEKVLAAEIEPFSESDVILSDYKNIYMSDDRLYNEFYMLRASGSEQSGIPSQLRMGGLTQ